MKSPFTTAWVNSQYIDDQSINVLQGNRAGLEALQSLIQETLENGESEISEEKIRSEWEKIEVIQQDPPAEPNNDQSSTITTLGCLLLAVLGVFIFGNGVVATFSWMMKLFAE